MTNLILTTLLLANIPFYLKFDNTAILRKTLHWYDKVCVYVMGKPFLPCEVCQSDVMDM